MSWSCLARKLSVNVGTFKNYHSQHTAPKRAQYIPLRLLIKLFEFFNLDANSIENNSWIKSIRSGKSRSSSPIENPKFPIKLLDKNLAAIIGALCSEGYLHKAGGFAIWNKNKELMEELTAITNSYFKGMKLKLRTYLRKDNSRAFYLVFPEICGNILICGLGLKPGKKPIVNSGIPKLYLELAKSKKTKAILSTFLSWIFAGDGWLTIFTDHLGQKHRVLGLGFSIDLTNKKQKEIGPPKLLTNCAYILKKVFDIQYNGPFISSRSKYKDKFRKLRISYAYAIHIQSYENLKKFDELIRFPKSDKLNNQKLIKVLNSYIRPKRCDNRSLQDTIFLVKNLSAKGLKVTKHVIKNETKLNINWIERLLKKAVDKEYIKIIGGGERLKGWRGGRAPYIYNG